MVTIRKRPQLCDDCKSLVGALQYVPPHRNLRNAAFLGVMPMFGHMKIRHYECRNCGSRWMQELGMYGRGWVEE